MFQRKKWCAHPTRHRHDTKIGQRPSHPIGHHPISDQLARNIQTYYRRSIGMSKIFVKQGDRLCKMCYYHERDRFEQIYSYQFEQKETDDDQNEETDSQYSMDISSTSGEETQDEESDGTNNDSVYSAREERANYKRTLDSIFQLLDITKIIDIEQIRILTIAPASWGRNKIVDFFNCTEHQARASIELRQTNGILAFPTFLRGNEPTDLVTIDKILSYYRRDGISRPSPNRKDVVLINGTYVGKRFIENPSIDIGKSKFFSLRPKDVKPESPHEVCLCIYHENMALLLKARNSKFKSTVQLNDLICSCVCSTEDEAC
ncbi:unnamed protein product [Adineta ricciae]|uniref:Uncharacterized protein n=1 Tax=Adineta ricciae TaxID=249248 RepID=A0A816EKC9_ADIRI|nr:unnamed protein product [Adineta ricciae]